MESMKALVRSLLLISLNTIVNIDFYELYIIGLKMTLLGGNIKPE
jgi:hypothetical protein